MKSAVLLLFILTQIHFCLAEVPNYDKPYRLHYRACASSMDAFHFSNHSMLLKKYCTNVPALGTIVVCLKDKAPSLDVGSGAIEFMDHYCKDKTMGKFDQIYENATKYMVSNSSGNLHGILYVPIKITDEAYDKWYDSYHRYYWNYNMSNYYGYAILAYWLLVMVLSSISKFLQSSGLILKLFGPQISFLQKHIFLPSLINSRQFNYHNEPFKIFKLSSGLLPTRVDGLIIAGYLLVHIIVMAVNWDKQSFDQPVYGTLRRQVSRYLGDRTGIIAFAHFPLIFLFAGRNNILSSVTGFSFASFVQFHKWTGRIMFIDAAIHSITFSYLFASQGEYISTLIDETYVLYGIAATVAAGILVFQSYHWFRKHMYEIFLYGHILVAIAFTVGVWHHCRTLGWMEYCYCSVAIWAFDRFIRLMRIAAFGVRTATVTTISNDTVRVCIKKVNPPLSNGTESNPLAIHGGPWHAKPGQYVYCYFMLPGCFWQSHPFTVSDSTIRENEIVLYIKLKNGATNYLFNKVLKKPHLVEQTIKVLIEGPYGEYAPLNKYKNTLLIGGGNGIPGPYDHALKLCRKQINVGSATSISRERKNNTNPFGEAATGGQKQWSPHLIWVAKDFESVQWFKKEIQILGALGGRITIFLTRQPSGVSESEFDLQYNHEHHHHHSGIISSNPFDDKQVTEKTGALGRANNCNAERVITANSSSSSSKSSLDNNKEEKNLLELENSPDWSACKFIFKKPNLEELISETVSEAQGSTSIYACGPGSFSDSLRNNIAKLVDKHSSGRIDYYEEQQVW